MSKVNKVNRAEAALPGPHNIPKINDGKKKNQQVTITAQDGTTVRC